MLYHFSNCVQRLYSFLSPLLVKIYSYIEVIDLVLMMRFGIVTSLLEIKCCRKLKYNKIWLFIYKKCPTPLNILLGLGSLLLCFFLIALGFVPNGPIRRYVVNWFSESHETLFGVSEAESEELTDNTESPREDRSLWVVWSPLYLEDEESQVFRMYCAMMVSSLFLLVISPWLLLARVCFSCLY